MTSPIRTEFELRPLVDERLARARAVSAAFSSLLTDLEALIGTKGREMAIIRTKLQEAHFFACETIAAASELPPLLGLSPAAAQPQPQEATGAVTLTADLGRLVKRLNEFIDIDRVGMSELLFARHKVDVTLAVHAETIATESNEMSALALLNSLLPKGVDGLGIVVVRTEDGVATKATLDQRNLFMNLPLGESPYKPVGVADGAVAAPVVDAPPVLEPSPPPEAARVPTPCLEPEKMHGFCDQQGGTDDPASHPADPLSHS